jgi:hypothetical protein
MPTLAAAAASTTSTSTVTSASASACSASDAHDSAHRGTPLVEHLLDLDPELLPVQCLHLALLLQSELERLGRIGRQRRTGRRRRCRLRSEPRQECSRAWIRF